MEPAYALNRRPTARAVHLTLVVGVMSLVGVHGCSDDTSSGPPPCVSDAECGVICAASCGSDPVLSAACIPSLMTCGCECDTSGSGGAGGSAGGGTGGAGGGGGAIDRSCGAATECTPDAPSICGTLCIEPICGGIDNFDTARCGNDGRCECICLDGACSE